MALPAAAEPFDHLVRLHVIADDDSPAAQAFKLEIRDAVLTCAQELLSACGDAAEAWDVLNAHLSDFLAAAIERAKALGFTDRLSVQSGVFAFPDRTYGDVVIPAGEYRALRVIIGDGEGQNWWCVLYPNLCFIDAVHAVVPDEGKKELKEVLDEEEYEMVTATSKFKIKWFFFR